MNVYGLIGFPLEHSFSKKYFTEKFEEEKIANARFELFPLRSVAELSDLLFTNTELKGLAVTIPYKVEVIPLLSELTIEASTIGAVNCIQILQGKLIGHNTDVIGFEKSLLPLPAADYSGALVLGRGGAAKAVIYVLEKIGIPYKIISRDHNLIKGELHYDQITPDILDEFPLIINCTPVGMHPYEMEKPLIPYELLKPENFLYDLIYNPAETLFLSEGKRKGCTIKNGYEMLCLQAEENWKIWSGEN